MMRSLSQAHCAERDHYQNELRNPKKIVQPFNHLINLLFFSQFHEQPIQALVRALVNAHTVL